MAFYPLHKAQSQKSYSVCPSLSVLYCSEDRGRGLLTDLHEDGKFTIFEPNAPTTIGERGTICRELP